MAFLTLSAQRNLYAMSPLRYDAVTADKYSAASPYLQICLRGWWGRRRAYGIPDTGPIGGSKKLQNLPQIY